MMFSAESWISDKNIVNLIFLKPLSNNLLIDDLNVMIDGTNIEFEVKKLDSKNYEIIPDSIKENQKLIQIKILHNLTSTDNSILNNFVFDHEIKVYQTASDLKSIEKKVENSKAMGKTGSISGVSLSAAVSLLNFDISPLFDFLNTAEIFYSVYLFNIDLSPILSEFLLSIRIQKSIPNLLEYIFNYKDNVNKDKKFNKFGYKSHL